MLNKIFCAVAAAMLIAGCDGGSNSDSGSSSNSGGNSNRQPERTIDAPSGSNSSSGGNFKYDECMKQLSKAGLPKSEAEKACKK